MKAKLSLVNEQARLSYYTVVAMSVLYTDKKLL